MPQDPLVGGVALRRPAIASPNYVSGVSGWTINADGTAQFNQLTLIVQTTGGAAILIYLGTAAAGNLIGSWSATAGTDAYGNAYPAGLYAQQGQLAGMTVTASTLVNCILSNPTITGPMVSGAAISGGTMVETAITFDSVGGLLLAYTTTTTSTTFNTAGLSTWTSTISGTAKVECWGADAGAGGGTATAGGEGGGGGEYAANTSYPVTNGQVYQVSIGAKGIGGSTGNAGSSGGDTVFDNGGVRAQGGRAGASGTGGAGGNYATAPVSHAGGNGGGDGTQSTGGCGGGGRAGATGAGGNGAKSSSGTGAAGGAAGTGTGGAAGGAGGNAAANGNAGGGGGGAGAAAGAVTQTGTYKNTHTYAYYGADVAGPTYLNNTDGNIIQGNPNAGNGNYPGDQYSFVLFNYAQIQSDLSGWTIDDITVALINSHFWYNSGGYVCLGYSNRTTFPNSNVGAGAHANVLAYWQDYGTLLTKDIEGYGIGSAFQSGAATCLVLGPATPVPPSMPSLYDYGYWLGGPGAVTMVIKSHKAGSAVQGGNGADGMAKVTVTNTSTLVLSVSPVAGTDAHGNAYPAGVAGIHQGTDYAALADNGSNAQLGFGAAGGASDVALTRQAAGILAVNSAVQLKEVTLPTTPTGAAILWADADGNVQKLLPSGLSDRISTGQGFAVTSTVTQAASTALTGNWTIPAGDGQVGTVYRLTARGYGEWATSGPQSLSVQTALNGAAVRTEVISSAVFATSQHFEWRAVYEVCIIATGNVSTGKAWLTGEMTLSATGATHTLTTGQVTVLFGSNDSPGSANGEAFDTTASNTMQIMALWGSTTGTPTITCRHQTWERVGQ